MYIYESDIQEKSFVDLFAHTHIYIYIYRERERDLKVAFKKNHL